MPQYKDTMKWLDDCNARGTRVFAQALTAENNFQFTFEEWNLFDTSPVWREMTLGTVEERAAKMADPERRAAAKAEFDDSEYGGVGIVFSLDELIVGELHKPEIDHYTGWTVTEIAKDRGCHPIDAMLDIAFEDDMKALFVTAPRPTDMEAMKEVANSAFALPGVSDGGAHTKFITLGRYPTEFLTSLVRDNEVMDLEQAHWRLSAYPALAAGFRDRGTIREGAPADIVIYDLEKLEMGETEKAYDYPAGAWRLIRKPRAIDTSSSTAKRPSWTASARARRAASSCATALPRRSCHASESKRGAHRAPRLRLPTPLPDDVGCAAFSTIVVRP